MSEFQPAHDEVMGSEGGVNYDPNDRGNVVVNGIVTVPTYKGVAPKPWPKWAGWKYITDCAGQLVKMPLHGTREYYNWAKHLNSKLAEIKALQQMVLDFYKANFWKRLGEINDQALATWVYDKDVNTGSMGSRWLQDSLGVAVDGMVGSKTIAAANQADPVALLEEMKGHATVYYITIAQKPGQKGFFKSWIARVGLSPEKLAQANSEAHRLGIIA